MKSLLMMLVTLISVLTGFVLTNTLYHDGRRISMENDNYIVVAARLATHDPIRQTSRNVDSRMIY